MSRRSQKDSTNSEFIIKNKSIIVYLLSVVALFLVINFLDYYVLPSSKTTDVITHYAVRTSGGKNGTKPQTVSYHYYMQKGFTFSTLKHSIEKGEIELEHSLLFKSVTQIKSYNKDCTNLLSSDLSINGIQFYFFIVLLFQLVSA